MASLTEQLDALLAEHGLDYLTVTQQRKDHDKGTFTCVTAKSTDGHFAVTTMGEPAEQIASCLRDIAGKRVAAALTIADVELAAA